MSWHYLQGQEEASWADTSLDGAPSALLSLLPTREACCSRGSGMECSPSSPCGTMCERSTASLGADTLTSLAEGSHARTSALPEGETGLTESDQDCGPKWPGSLARYNPGSRSWRTAQCSLLGGLTEFSETFPRWGMMRNSELFPQPTPVLRIEGKGSGYWPTPRAQEPGRTTEGYGRGLAELVEGKEQRKANTPSGNWPTPTCSDAFTDKLKSDQQTEGSMHSVNLSQAVKMCPTPNCAGFNTGPGARQMLKDKVDAGELSASIAVAMTGGTQIEGLAKPEKAGGQLNPDWVELLMGWPRGWTAIGDQDGRTAFRAWLLASQGALIASKQSETAKCLPLLSSHGIPSTPESNEAEAA